MISTEIARLQGAKSDLKTSIEGKGVTVPAATKIDGYAALVDQIQQGGGGATVDPDADVRFFDYDGTLLYTYSAADFANLTELPANPSHQGLTAQGWNWSLADAKAYVAAYGILDIGQMYVTDDGKTRLYMDLRGGRLSIELNWYQTGSVILDWGDGSSPETYGGAADKNASHTYSASGEYVITFDVASGELYLGTSVSPLFPDAFLSMANSLKRVEIGAGLTYLRTLTFGNNSFTGMYGIESITLPNTITYIGSSCFLGCVNLRCICWPRSATAMNAQTFTGADGLKTICLPPTLTSIGNLALCYAHTLERVCIPELVTNIPSTCFYQSYALQKAVVPAGVTTINNSSFAGIWLRELTIPDTVTTIGNAVLYQCRALTYASIGSGVASMGDNVFNGCSSLKEVHIKATTPPNLGSSAFAGIASDCIIYVPSASLSAYQGATNWSTYASQMVGE